MGSQHICDYLIADALPIRPAWGEVPALVLAFLTLGALAMTAWLLLTMRRSAAERRGLTARRGRILGIALAGGLLAGIVLNLLPSVGAWQGWSGFPWSYDAPWRDAVPLWDSTTDVRFLIPFVGNMLCGLGLASILCLIWIFRRRA